MDGACLMDLGPNHEYRPEKGKELLDPTTLATYVPTAQILATPLHQAVNRFHKTFCPIVWARYRMILAYYERTGTWPSDATAEDFATQSLAWCTETGVSKDLQSTQACLAPAALQQLATVATAELAPVASVLGGLVGNEVIKALSGKGTPSNNTLLLEGSSGKAWAFLVQAKK